MARSDQTQFSIQVLEGPNSGAVLDLEGRGLPYRAGAGGSISFGRTQRTKLTWYPGNPVASQQIVGSTLMPTTINGVWKERYLGENQPISLCEAFEEFCDQGVQLRVSWETIVRQGIVKSFVWYPGDPTGGLSDIRWECTFEWVSAGEPPRRVIGEPPASMRVGVIGAGDAVGNIYRATKEIIVDLQDFNGARKSLFEPKADDLEDLSDALQPPLQTLAVAAARFGDQAQLQGVQLNDSAQALQASQTIAAELGALVASLFPGIIVVGDSPEEVMRDALIRYEYDDAVTEGLRVVYEQRVRVERITRPPVFAIVPALVGGDLRALALAYYGDADVWHRIAQVNGLEVSEIPGNIREILIPLTLPPAVDSSQGTNFL